MTDLLIADVNDAHTVTDWAAYAAFSPVLIAKATQGTTFVSPTFTTQRTGAAHAGLEAFGMYHFWQPGEDPVAQAKHAVATVGALRTAPLEWLILDVEAGDDMASYHAFCAYADSALGRRTWLYGGRQLTAQQTSRPRWIARYYDEKPAPPGSRTSARCCGSSPTRTPCPASVRRTARCTTGRSSSSSRWSAADGPGRGAAGRSATDQVSVNRAR